MQRRAGSHFEPIMGDLGLDAVPHEYIAAVENLRRHKQIEASYMRPTAKHSDVKTLHSRGAFNKIPLEQRLVPVEDDPWLFFEMACALEFPKKSYRSLTSNDIDTEVAHKIASLGPQMADAREAWMVQWEADLKPLCELDALARTRVDPLVATIMQKARIVSTAAICEAHDLGDTWIAYDLMHGMIPSGSGEHGEREIRDSGLFRPCGRYADYSEAELQAGTARPRYAELHRDGSVHVRYGPAYPDGATWHKEIMSTVRESAETTMRQAGVKPSEAQAAMKAAASDPSAIETFLEESVPDVGHRQRLRKLMTCEVMSREEAGSQPPTMAKPMREEQFKEWATDKGGYASARIGKRHVVESGVDDKGVPKLRAIDNFRDNGMKYCTASREVVDMPSWLWPLLAAMLLVRAFMDAAWQAARNGGRAVWIIPAITLSLDDLRKAYRTVPVRQVPLLANLCAWYSFKLLCVVVQRVFGHYFGVRAANNNFSRIPRIATVAAARSFAVMTKHYVDDIMAVDSIFGKDTALKAIRCVLLSMGWDVELAKRPDGAYKKRKPANVTNVALGGLTDLTDAPKGFGTAEPDPARLERIRALLREYWSGRKITPSQAESLVGKAKHATQQLANRSGAACMQPFADRSLDKRGFTEWTEEMSHALECFELITSSEFLPKVRVDYNFQSTLSDDDKCVIVCTDAAYHNERNVDGEVVKRVCRLSVNCYDQKDMRHYLSYCDLPEEYYTFLEQGLLTYINKGELIAGIACLSTYPELFRGRKVIHFIDNAGALSNLINGYANKPDAARLVNMFHVALIALRVDWYGEWVPSKANIADLMTRPERFEEFRQGLGGLPAYDAEEQRVHPSPSLTVKELELPPLDLMSGELLQWARTMRDA